MGVPCLCRALCLAGLSAALAAAQRCSSPDELVLFQKDVQSHKALAGPSTDHSGRELALKLTGMLQQAREMPPLRQIPGMADMDLPPNVTMEDVMQIINDVLKLFEDQAFVSAVHKAISGYEDAFTNFTSYSQPLLSQLVDRAAAAPDEAIFSLLQEYVSGEGAALMDMAVSFGDIFKHVVQAMPAGKLKDQALPLLKGVDGNLTEAAGGMKTAISFLFSANGSSFCSKFVPAIVNMTKTDALMQNKILPEFNKTVAEQVESMKPMLQAFAPKVADTLLGVVEHATNMTSTMMVAYSEWLHPTSTEISALLESRLHCSLQSAGSRVGLSFLAAAAVWLSL